VDFIFMVEHILVKCVRVVEEYGVEQLRGSGN
jgi:hypothetical protein